jgi:hypothetical protein
MKTRIFNQGNSTSTKSTGHFITIQTKNGAISFSKDLVSLIDIKKNKVQFVQDEDKPKDWYLQVTSSEDGFPLRGKNAGSIMQNTVLCREILKSLGVLGQGSWRIMVATTPEKGFNLPTYPIITKSIKEVKLTRNK